MSVSMIVSQLHTAGLRADNDYSLHGPRQMHGIDLSMIGPVLRQAREDQGLTLPAVAESLLVRKGHLNAIECACWDTLPHEVYVKGYVKAYAAYLHVEDKLERHLRKFCGCAEAEDQDIGAHPAARRSEGSSTNAGSAGRFRLPSAAVVGFSSICIAIMVALAFFTIRQPAPAISLFDVFSAYNGAVADLKKNVADTLAARPEMKPEEVKPAAAPMPAVRVIPVAQPAVRQEQPLPASTDAEEDEPPDGAGVYKASMQDDATSTR